MTSTVKIKIKIKIRFTETKQKTDLFKTNNKKKIKDLNQLLITDAKRSFDCNTRDNLIFKYMYKNTQLNCETTNIFLSQY